MKKASHKRTKVINMTEDEVVEIVKESHLWESLSKAEKEEAISHALKITGASMSGESRE